MYDEKSRDYDISQIQDEDYRFEYAKKEGILTLAGYFIAIVVAFVLAYSMMPENPEDVQYFMGFPTWLCAGACVFVVATVFFVIYFAKAKIFTFEARLNGGEEK